MGYLPLPNDNKVYKVIVAYVSKKWIISTTPPPLLEPASTKLQKELECLFTIDYGVYNDTMSYNDDDNLKYSATYFIFWALKNMKEGADLWKDINTFRDKDHSDKERI